MHGARVRVSLAMLTVSLVMGSACSNPRPAGESLRERVDAVVSEQLGVDPMFQKVRVVAVTRGGETVLETNQESSPEDYHVSFSVTKSITSTLIGIAIGEGLIAGVDATLGDLLPDHREQMTRPVAATTVEQLLTMTSGLTAPEKADGFDFMRSRNPVRYILTHPYEPPGRRFVYSNEASHLLAAILVESTGMDVLSYARQKLFDPIGIPTEPADEPVASDDDEAVSGYVNADNFGWPVDPQGIHLGWAFIKLRAADMTRFGQLYLEEGVWDGREVVSPGWVAEATTAHVATDQEQVSYGYQWWVRETEGHPTHHAQGFGGQLIQVVPDLDLVVAIATEVDPTDAADRGVDPSRLAVIVDLIVKEVDS